MKDFLQLGVISRLGGREGLLLLPRVRRAQLSGIFLSLLRIYLKINHLNYIKYTLGVTGIEDLNGEYMQSLKVSRLINVQETSRLLSSFGRLRPCEDLSLLSSCVIDTSNLFGRIYLIMLRIEGEHFANLVAIRH